MQAYLEPWTIGVEEEYQIIDPHTRELAPAVEHILAHIDPTFRANVQHELQLSQIEIATPVCQNLAEVRNELTQARHHVITAATRAKYSIAAAGTHPFHTGTCNILHLTNVISLCSNSINNSLMNKSSWAAISTSVVVTAP